MSRSAHHIPRRHDDLGPTWEERYRSVALRALVLRSLRYSRREQMPARAEGRCARPRLVRTGFAIHQYDRAYRSTRLGSVTGQVERRARCAVRMRCDEIRRAHRAGADIDLDVPPTRHRHGAFH
ncbi:hypothetical protein OG735_37230 [Streptomyces sp. NBC_01210]|uniref:hypothetical protein n=1 Tax=Streptomyces sp. NBC_01210 TaxID=2903774 RepID=UPI002E153809|nr:hypothetical protein OG735_37230 [Streptomyces sp. NBC_01210]